MTVLMIVVGKTVAALDRTSIGGTFRWNIKIHGETFMIEKMVECQNEGRLSTGKFFRKGDYLLTRMPIRMYSEFQEVK